MRWSGISLVSEPDTATCLFRWGGSQVWYRNHGYFACFGFRRSLHFCHECVALFKAKKRESDHGRHRMVTPRAYFFSFVLKVHMEDIAKYPLPYYWLRCIHLSLESEEHLGSLCGIRNKILYCQIFSIREDWVEVEAFQRDGARIDIAWWMNIPDPGEICLKVLTERQRNIEQINEELTNEQTRYRYFLNVLEVLTWLPSCKRGVSETCLCPTTPEQTAAINHEYETSSRQQLHTCQHLCFHPNNPQWCPSCNAPFLSFISSLSQTKMIPAERK